MYDTLFSKIKKSGELRAVSHHRSRFIICACHISIHREVSHARSSCHVSLWGTQCAYTELSPTIATMPIIAARIGMIKTNCFLIASLSVLLSYKGL